MNNVKIIFYGQLPSSYTVLVVNLFDSLYYQVNNKINDSNNHCK